MPSPQKIREAVKKPAVRKRAAVALSVVLTLSGSAWAATNGFWVGNMGPDLGQPPGSSQQTVGSGVMGQVVCPIAGPYAAGCTNTFSGGTFASSGNIQTLDNQVYSLQQQLTQDISWLGYYTARSIRNSATARTLANTQNQEQVPANMPCANNSCTAQANMASDTAGANGAWGKKNDISGVPMAAKQVKQGLLAKRTTAFIGSSWTEHSKLFCSPSEIKAGICAAGSPVSAEPNADIEGTTLLSSNGIQAPIHPNLDMDARVQFIQNVTNQMPVPTLSPNAYKTAAGHLAAGAKLQYQAQMNLAQTALNQIAALHTPVQGLGTTLNNTIKGLGMPPVPANISMLQYLAYMQKAQYGNPKWYIDLAKDGSVALQRERAIMQAEQMQLQYLAFRQRMDIEAMDASQYAEQSQANYAKVPASLTGAVGMTTAAPTVAPAAPAPAP